MRCQLRLLQSCGENYNNFHSFCYIIHDPHTSVGNPVILRAVIKNLHSSGHPPLANFIGVSGKTKETAISFMTMKRRSTGVMMFRIATLPNEMFTLMYRLKCWFSLYIPLISLL